MYRKSHLYLPEFAVFSATTLDVVQTPVGVVGPLGASSTRPRRGDDLALAGAQILVIPSAVPLDYEHLLHLRTRARAQDNQVFAIGCNMTGHGFAGGLWSPILGARCSPRREKPTVLIVEMDMAAAPANAAASHR